jgi:hypothetical protein
LVFVSEKKELWFSFLKGKDFGFRFLKERALVFVSERKELWFSFSKVKGKGFGFGFKSKK